MLGRAIGKRVGLRTAGVEAFRAFGGSADGLEGVYLDVYGPGAALNVYEGRAPRWVLASAASREALAVLAPLGVRAVYVKPFAKDRSKLGGDLPAGATDPNPAAGEALPEAVVIRENGCAIEIRLWDGLSTGLFLDQRNNRQWVAEGVARRVAAGERPAVLNTFAYTCGFSVAAARAGAVTTSVDVSGRYLDWGKRNFALNGLDPELHRFARMDTFEFLAYAARKELRYDLVILDPPSFASGSKKKGIRPWSSTADYHRLVREASALLTKGGAIFASTNTQELCGGDRLEREVIRGLGHEPRWLKLPAVPVDFSGERGRFAACAFVPMRAQRGG